MQSSDQSSRGKLLDNLLTPKSAFVALLLGTAIGVGGVGYALSGQSLAATPPPLSLTPTNPQTGFAPLVARVKPAVVEVTTVSQPLDGGQDQQLQQMPDLPAP